MRTITFLFIVFLTPVWGQTHAILDSLYTQIEVKAIDKMLVTDFKRLKILDEQGYSHSIYRDYHNSFRKVKSFRYTIYDAGGNRVKRFGLNDAMDVMFNAPYEVTDSRMLILDPSYRRFPFFVEIETVTQYDEFLDMPEWIPRYEHNMAVRFAALSLRCPSDYEFRMQSHHLANPTVSSEGRIDRYLWTLRDLAASPPSSSQRLFTASQPRVIISPYKFKMGGIAGGYSSWSEFGDWYLALNSGPQTLSERTKMDLKEIRAASDGDHELVRQVYQYMQQKTRYVSIQLGIGGYKALSVAWVDEMGYGDCKALTNYMHALLAEVGISSNQVLVKAGEDAEDVVADVPSNQFNHIFLAVPHANDTTWLECTSQLAPASYVGTFTDDRTALWLAPGKSRVIRTPSFSASKSTRKTESVILLDAQGNAKIKHHRSQGGFYFDEMMAYAAMSSVEQEQFNLTKFSYSDFSIQSFKYEVRQPEQVLWLSYELTVNTLAGKGGDKLFLPLNILDSPERAIGIDLLNQRTEVRRALTLYDVSEIVIPDGWRYDALPERKFISSAYGTLEMKVTGHTHNRFVIHRKLTLNKGLYSGERFLKFYDFIKSVKNLDHKKIVMLQKS